MDRQVPRLTIEDLLRRIPTEASTQQRRFSFLIPGYAVSLEADACRVMDLFAKLPAPMQLQFVKLLLEALPQDGDSALFTDDIFTGEEVFVTRSAGEGHIKLVVVH